MSPRASKKSDITSKDLSSADNYIQNLNSKFGDGSGFLLDDDSRKVEVIPSGLPTLDILALRCGGLPKGRIIEIIGPESSGKTTLALQFAAKAQEHDPNRIIHFIDAEHALDPTYAYKLGIKENRFAISQPDNGEQALNMVEHAASSSVVSLIVVDSVAALTPQAEIEGQMGDSHMGLQARLMSQAMRKLTAVVQRSNVSVIFINQIRLKIGVVFGNPETTPGGNALKFYSSVRIETRRGKLLKENDIAFGQETNIKIIKNKVAPPFGSCTVDLIYGKGFDADKSLLDVCVAKGVIDQSGAWFSYKGERVGQGSKNSSEVIHNNPELKIALQQEIYEKL